MNPPVVRTIKYENAVYVYSDPAMDVDCLLCDAKLEADMDEITIHIRDDHGLELDMGGED